MIEMMTHPEQEAAKRERLNEVGTEPPCPMCQLPRVKRSDYVRCSPCGVNWLAGEDLMKDPRAERWRETIQKARMKAIKPTDTAN